MELSRVKNKSWVKFKKKNTFFASQMSFDSGFDAGFTFARDSLEKDNKKLRDIIEQAKPLIERLMIDFEEINWNVDREKQWLKDASK